MRIDPFHTIPQLFYLRQQDILEGSESVRVEVRDKDSGIVLGVKNLVAELDYDIDYLQGRILLSEVLPRLESFLEFG